MECLLRVPQNDIDRSSWERLKFSVCHQVIGRRNGMRCPGCGAENAAGLDLCGNCGYAMDGSGQGATPKTTDNDLRWETALNSPSRYSEVQADPKEELKPSRSSKAFSLASEVLAIGLIFLLIGFVMTAYVAEKMEQGDITSDMPKVAKWADYLRYIGEILAVMGLVGIAFGLSRSHL